MQLKSSCGEAYNSSLLRLQLSFVHPKLRSSHRWATELKGPSLPMRAVVAPCNRIHAGVSPDATAGSATTVKARSGSSSILLDNDGGWSRGRFAPKGFNVKTCSSCAHNNMVSSVQSMVTCGGLFHRLIFHIISCYVLHSSLITIFICICHLSSSVHGISNGACRKGRLAGFGTGTFRGGGSSANCRAWHMAACVTTCPNNASQREANASH